MKLEFWSVYMLTYIKDLNLMSGYRTEVISCLIKDFKWYKTGKHGSLNMII
jgi:hypothetical protein